MNLKKMFCLASVGALMGISTPVQAQSTARGFKSNNAVSATIYSQKTLVDNVMKVVEKHEKYVSHAYFGANGNLLTGYGSLIPDKQSYMAIDWVQNGVHLTAAQKKLNYKLIMALKEKYGSNYPAHKQEKMKAFGTITETTARTMAKEHIENISIPNVNKTLRRDGVNFYLLPLSVKTALVDIEYNTGNFARFIKMRAAIKKMDFENMAKESHRAAPIPKSRNQEIHNLIMQGKTEMLKSKSHVGR